MVYKNKWVVAASLDVMQNNPAGREIARALGLTLPTAQLLLNRGCRTPEEAKAFLAKEEEQLHDPFLMADMDEAAYRIVEAVENGERITIFGDYDVDGVTSVSILYLYLQSHGADVSFYIPSRAGEGYGMSAGAVRKLAKEGCRLIITVDTGITAVEEVRLAMEMGVDIIVTDHHECHEQHPEAVAVVNPRRPDCPYPFKELAGVGVVFKVLCALEAVLHPEFDMMDCVRNVAKEYCDLVAIGTVADVMPVRDENRLIVSYGLSLIENTERPGLIELIEASRAEGKSTVKKKITASFIGYTIAPRINAAGRIRDASMAVQLFLTDNSEDAAKIARDLCEINRERQAEENRIIEEAYAQIAASENYENDPVIVLAHEAWHHGIIGIVASRITEKYGKPSILISFEGSDGELGGQDDGKGSGRSIKGMNLVETLSQCADLLEKYGGHELAAGLTIKRENLEAFRQRINERARECFGDAPACTQLEAECEISPRDITMEQANELYYLEPFGVSNPVPVFVLRNVPLYDIALVGGGKHTRMIFRLNGTSVSAMCFRQTLADLDVYPGDMVDVMFTLDINEFQNQRNVQMIVRDVRLTEKQFAAESAERELYEKIRSGMKPGEIGLDPVSAEDVVPTREEFAAVYKLLQRELRVEHEVFSIRALLHLLRGNGMPMRYVKLRFILDTFNELNLLSVRELSRANEIFAFRYVYVKTKISLDRSEIYRKLKADYAKRIES